MNTAKVSIVVVLMAASFLVGNQIKSQSAQPDKTDEFEKVTFRVNLVNLSEMIREEKALSYIQGRYEESQDKKLKEEIEVQQKKIDNLPPGIGRF